jgi:hypothetical protein
MYQRVQASGSIRPTVPTPRVILRSRTGRRSRAGSRRSPGHSLRQIADWLGRCPSTVSREVKANGARKSLEP